MWQITWMFSFLPDWFWSLVLIAGVFGLIASWILKPIPFISNHTLPIKVISIILLLIGVYFQGVIANEEKYKAEHARLKEEIAIAETKAKEVNVEIKESVIYKDKIIKQKGDTVVKYVDRLVKADPEIITQEISTENKLSEVERKNLEDKIKELQKANKECPVPRIVIESINNAAKPPEMSTKK